MRHPPADAAGLLPARDAACDPAASVARSRDWTDACEPWHGVCSPSSPESRTFRIVHCARDGYPSHRTTCDEPARAHLFRGEVRPTRGRRTRAGCARHAASAPVRSEASRCDSRRAARRHARRLARQGPDRTDAARARRLRRRTPRGARSLAPIPGAHGQDPAHPALRAAGRDREPLDARTRGARQRRAPRRPLRRVPAELPFGPLQRELRRALRPRTRALVRARARARPGRALPRAGAPRPRPRRGARQADPDLGRRRPRAPGADRGDRPRPRAARLVVRGRLRLRPRPALRGARDRVLGLPRHLDLELPLPAHQEQRGEHPPLGGRGASPRRARTAGDRLGGLRALQPPGELVVRLRVGGTAGVERRLRRAELRARVRAAGLRRRDGRDRTARALRANRPPAPPPPHPGFDAGRVFAAVLRAIPSQQRTS